MYSLANPNSRLITERFDLLVAHFIVSLVRILALVREHNLALFDGLFNEVAHFKFRIVQLITSNIEHLAYLRILI